MLRQAVLSDRAIQPQPLHLQEAAVLRATCCDVQLGTGDRAGGQQLPPGLWEPAHSTPRESKAPLQASPSLHLPQLWKAPSGEPAGALTPCRQEEEFEANTQDVRVTASVSKGQSLCEELRARGMLSLWIAVYISNEPDAR